MSLRRSARTATKHGRDDNDEPIPVTQVKKPRTKPRKVKIQANNSGSEIIAGMAVQVQPLYPDQRGSEPSTPKRSKILEENPDLNPEPLVTPTPAFVSLMLGNVGSSKAIGLDQNQKPLSSPSKVTEPVPKNIGLDVTEPRTHAILMTPNGSRYQATKDANSLNLEKRRKQGGLQAVSGDRPFAEPDSLLKTACAHLISVDPDLEPLIEKNPCPVFSSAGLTEAVDPFRSLTTGIMAQQVSGAAASSIKKKFTALFAPADCPNGYPHPKIVAATPLEKLRTAGLSQRKAEYIQGLAAQFASGELGVEMLMQGDDETVMEKLVAVRGLGKWSVEMFMCFGLKRMDVFSTGDLGVQRGMAHYVGRDVKKLKAKGAGGKWKYMSEKEMVEISDRFRPYR